MGDPPELALSSDERTFDNRRRMLRAVVHTNCACGDDQYFTQQRVHSLFIGILFFTPFSAYVLRKSPRRAATNNKRFGPEQAVQFV